MIDERMTVLVTGATGFVGGYLVAELSDAGHDAVGAPPSSGLDIADAAAVRTLVERVRPDVIAHLAAVASGQRAARDLDRAVRTNVGGTHAVMQAARSIDPRPGVLIVSSAEVYAPPDGTSPIDEAAPVGPRTTYGLLKLAQEAIARDAAQAGSIRTVIARPFNHVGPGQPPIAAVPSFAERIAAVRRGASRTITVGNLDVERDIGDVRDVVVAYRLICEAIADGRLGDPVATFNVSTGSGTRLRDVVGELSRLAGVEPELVVDSDLVRPDDPPRIVGDGSRLRAATGWSPRFETATTLADILAALPA
ncbi:MAG: GDP-mannose 4,6-dehydratase [Chloroflexi bacterium]|nr:GDP-mannose 4,6-dehydratase [Chloroflexota bacterium]